MIESEWAANKRPMKGLAFSPACESERPGLLAVEALLRRKLLAPFEVNVTDHG
jgi:hypothetical protein